MLSAKVEPIVIDPAFSPAWYAEVWGVSSSTVVKMFQDVEGVLKLGEKKRGKRTRQELRIPFSLAMRVYQERSR